MQLVIGGHILSNFVLPFPRPEIFKIFCVRHLWLELPAVCIESLQLVHIKSTLEEGLTFWEKILHENVCI